MIKAVILIGGPQKGKISYFYVTPFEDIHLTVLCFEGTRFRPLSFDLPKPLFPVAGYPIIYHHIYALSQVLYFK